jgi:hypothetical protein
MASGVLQFSSETTHGTFDRHLIDLPLGYPLEATQERMGERRERERGRHRKKFYLLTIKK